MPRWAVGVLLSVSPGVYVTYQGADYPFKTMTQLANDGYAGTAGVPVPHTGGLPVVSPGLSADNALMSGQISGAAVAEKLATMGNRLGRPSLRLVWSATGGPFRRATSLSARFMAKAGRKCGETRRARRKSRPSVNALKPSALIARTGHRDILGLVCAGTRRLRGVGPRVA